MGRLRRKTRARVRPLVVCAVLVVIGSAVVVGIVSQGGPKPNPNGPSGQAPPGNIAGWQQVFSYDFPKSVPLGQFPQAAAKYFWAYPDGWRDTEGNGIYEPSKVVSIANGIMNVHLHSDSRGDHLVAAIVPLAPGEASTGTSSSPLPLHGQISGLYMVRFRADRLRGYKLAFLLWPDNTGSYQKDGEIDFPEGDLNSGFAAFVHSPGTGGAADKIGSADQVGFVAAANNNGGWYTATLERRRGVVKCFLNGKVVGVATSGLPTVPMHWVLQIETSTYGISPSSSTSGNVQIAWIAIYRR
jgi:hypothetical protein